MGWMGRNGMSEGSGRGSLTFCSFFLFFLFFSIAKFWGCMDRTPRYTFRCTSRNDSTFWPVLGVIAEVLNSDSDIRLGAGLIYPIKYHFQTPSLGWFVRVIGIMIAWLLQFFQVHLPTPKPYNILKNSARDLWIEYCICRQDFLRYRWTCK